jgi:glycogen(starch) synthase
MTTANLSFSVIINTVERAGPLRTLLRALEHQSYRNFEVVVVLGPTHDHSQAVIDAYAGRVRLVHCPVVNLSHSRNLGLLAARGDVVAFIDDDAVPCRRWLEQYARLLADPHLDVVGGAVWGAHPRFAHLQYRLGIYSALAEQQDVRASWIEAIVPAGQARFWTARIPGGNTAMRRAALLAAGGFDEFYEFVAEEADLTLRMVSAGQTVLPVPEAPIYHFPASGPNRVAFTNQGRWWLRTRSRVYCGLKNGLAGGESLGPIAERTVKSWGANSYFYYQLWRQRELPFWDFMRSCWFETWYGWSGLWNGLFKPRRLLSAHQDHAQDQEAEALLPFQNDASARQPAVDPVSGRSPQITLLEPPLRICLLSNTYPPTQFGGVARLTHLMAQGLFELGHCVHVITRGEREEVKFYDGAYVHRIPNRLERYQAYRAYQDLYATLNYSHNVYDKVRSLIFNDGIQLVDSPFWQYEGLVTLRSGIVPVVVRIVTGLRQITALHRSQVDEFILMGDLEQSFLDQAHYLLPNTQATLEAVRSVYDLTSAGERCTLVPYGLVPVPQEQLSPFEAKAADEPLTVLFVGRLEKRKGILDLFAAVPQVLTKHPRARFVIAGSDNSQSDGYRLRTGMNYPAFFASRYGQYAEAVQFLGPVSDETLQELYRTCDVFVAPSLYESFGLVYLEAMNYAKPVIGCRAGGIPEVIDHGVTGLLVEPETPKALAEAISALLASPERRQEMGAAGRQQVLGRFHYLEMARKYADVYRQVIATYGAEAAEVAQGQTGELP